MFVCNVVWFLCLFLFVFVAYICCVAAVFVCCVPLFLLLLRSCNNLLCLLWVPLAPIVPIVLCACMFVVLNSFKMCVFVCVPSFL